MPDPDLVEYCRQNLAEFSAEELRETLLSEGCDAGDVERALAEAARAPARKAGPSALRVFLIATAWFGSLAGAVWLKSYLDGGAKKTDGARGPARPAAAPGGAERPEFPPFQARDLGEGFSLIGEDAKAGRAYWFAPAQTVIIVPPGFSRVPVQSGTGMRYDFAYKHDAEPFEVRVRFDSTAEATRAYQARPSGVDPDEPTEAVAAATAMGLTERPFSFDLIPPNMAYEQFLADWGALSPAFPLSQRRKAGGAYKVGVILHLHKDGFGNTQVLFLAGDEKTLDRHTNNPSISLGVRFAGPR